MPPSDERDQRPSEATPEKCPAHWLRMTIDRASGRFVCAFCGLPKEPEEPRSSEATPLLVSCEYCGAERGRPCESMIGIVGTFHETRIQAFATEHPRNKVEDALAAIETDATARVSETATAPVEEATPKTYALGEPVRVTEIIEGTVEQIGERSILVKGLDGHLAWYPRFAVSIGIERVRERDCPPVQEATDLCAHPEHKQQAIKYEHIEHDGTTTVARWCGACGSLRLGRDWHAAEKRSEK